MFFGVGGSVLFTRGPTLQSNRSEWNHSLRSLNQPINSKEVIAAQIYIEGLAVLPVCAGSSSDGEREAAVHMPDTFFATALSALINRLNLILLNIFSLHRLRVNVIGRVILTAGFAAHLVQTAAGANAAADEDEDNDDEAHNTGDRG